MAKSKGELGMSREINRRDFLNGTSIAIAGAVLGPGTSEAQGSHGSPAPASDPLPVDRDSTSPGRQESGGLPLKPERKLEFTTDEGTWISLDVSPDGETILFELLGDLYTVPFEGGKAVGLTSGMAFDSQPCYSPDGDRIAFLSDRGGAESVWGRQLRRLRSPTTEQGGAESVRIAELDSGRGVRRSDPLRSGRRPLGSERRDLDVPRQGRRGGPGN